MTLFEESLALLRERGEKAYLALTLKNMGLTMYAQGDVERASALFAESMLLFEETGDRLGVASVLAGLGGVAGKRNRPDRAAQLLGSAESIFTAAGMSGPSGAIDAAAYPDFVQAARAQLDEASFNAAWADGRAMALERAVAYALAEGVP